MALIQIPYGELPETLQVDNGFYKTKEIIRTLESITGSTILTKDESRTLKRFYNTSIQIKSYRVFNGIYFVGKNDDVLFVKEELK